MVYDGEESRQDRADGMYIQLAWSHNHINQLIISRSGWDWFPRMRGCSVRLMVSESTYGNTFGVRINECLNWHCSQRNLRWRSEQALKLACMRQNRWSGSFVNSQAGRSRQRVFVRKGIEDMAEGQDRDGGRWLRSMESKRDTKGKG